MEKRKNKKNKSFMVLVAALCILFLAAGTTITTVLLTMDNSRGYTMGFADGTPTTIATGNGFTAIIDSQGYMYITGVGVGESVNTNEPTPLASPYDTYKWKSVSAGHSHILALDKDGYLYGWGGGWNGLEHGVLGNGIIQNQRSPNPQKVGDKKWATIATSQYASYGIDAEGNLYAWGDNAAGQLGLGDSAVHGIRYYPTPTLVDGTKKWLAVSIGQSATLAIDEYGNVYGWGGNNGGMLYTEIWQEYDDMMEEWIEYEYFDNIIYTPILLCGGGKWKSVSAGHANYAAIDEDGKLYTWGDEQRGQLGIGTLPGTMVKISTPTLVNGTWKHVIAGVNMYIGIDSNDKMYTWGLNADGSLGIGNTDYYKSVTIPTEIASPYNQKTWANVAAGWGYVVPVIALTTGGEYYAWGYNHSGQLGLGYDNGGDVSNSGGHNNGVSTPRPVLMPTPEIACPCCSAS